MTIKGSSKAAGGSTPPFFNEPLAAVDYIAGKYYGPAVNYTNGLTSNALAGDIIYYVPFVPIKNKTFTKIGFYNGGAGDTGEKISLALYDDADKIPNDLITDYGEITLDASAAFREITISQATVKGTAYWLAYHGDNSTIIVQINGIETPLFPSFGLAGINISGSSISAFKESLAYASGFPATAAPDGGGAIPFVYFKL